MSDKSYSINIEIENVDFVEIDEDKIENYCNILKENIRKIFDTRIVNHVGDIKIVFNEK
jgi:hypothetical protein